MATVKEKTAKYNNNTLKCEERVMKLIETGEFVPGGNVLPKFSLDAIIKNPDISFGMTMRIIRESRNLTRARVEEILGISNKPLRAVENIGDEESVIGQRSAVGLNNKNIYRALVLTYGITKEQLVEIAKKNPYVGIMFWDTLWDEKDNILKVGKVLSIVRERKGISRRELAEMTGLIDYNISRMENRSLFSPRNLDKIFKALDITALDFYKTVIEESRKYKKNINKLILD